MKETPVYTTPSFHMFVWFLMNGIEPQEIKWISETKAVFIFKEFDDRETLMQDFFKQRQLQDWISAERQAKELMYMKREPTAYGR